MSKKKAIDFSNREWIVVDTTLPTVDSRWLFFEKSDKNKDEDAKSTNRSVARCTLCATMMDGRLDRMYGHILGKCKKATTDQQVQYRSWTAPLSNVLLEEPDTSVQGTKKGSGYFPKKKLSSQETDQYYEYLASALVTASIPHGFVENEEFRQSQEYLSKVTGVTFKTASVQDIRNAEQRLWNSLVHENFSTVNDEIGKTLLIDNWRDTSNQSHEAIAFDKIGDEDFPKFFYDTLQSEGKRKTSENLYSMLDESLLKMGEGAWNRVSAMCTDSPSAMVRLRAIVVERNPHVIAIGCVLHVLSLLTKDCLQVPAFATDMENNMTLVLFFKRSEIWSEKFNFYGSSRLVLFIKTR
jgi:hypothetical protein